MDLAQSAPREQSTTGPPAPRRNLSSLRSYDVRTQPVRPSQVTRPTCEVGSTLSQRSLLQTAGGHHAHRPCSKRCVATVGPCFKPTGVTSWLRSAPGHGSSQVPLLDPDLTLCLQAGGGVGLTQDRPQAPSQKVSPSAPRARPPAARLLTDAAAGIVTALAKRHHHRNRQRSWSSFRLSLGKRLT